MGVFYDIALNIVHLFGHEDIHVFFQEKHLIHHIIQQQKMTNKKIGR